MDNLNTIILTKKCCTCKEIKELTDFCNDKNKKDGRGCKCKKCQNEYNKKYILKHKEEKRKYDILRYENNKNKLLEKQKEYAKQHKEEKRKYDKVYKQLNKSKRNKWEKNKKENDSSYKIICDMRTRMLQALHGESKSAHTMELIGCSIEAFKIYLQQTAIQNGYKDFDINNFDGKKYHIDHIVPCSWFNMSDPNQQREAFNYKNCQILSAEENLKKNNKYYK
jgi:hypothetical protein